MESLTIITWFWGTKYDRSYIAKLERGLARNLRSSFKFKVIEPEPDHPLLQERGCFIRLQMFEPKWQAAHGLSGRIVCLDLDVVITGELDCYFDRPETFCILTGANQINPCPFNGSMMMVRNGLHANLWREFSVVKAYELPFFHFPDDQGWIAHRFPGAAVWKTGKKSGIWAFRKHDWPRDDELPAGARIVVFPGNNDPRVIEDLPWMQRHWR